jgi:hypothetical protein
MSTPKLAPRGFQLSESEWGKPEDTLVTAWYLTSENQAYWAERCIWCEKVRVLHPDLHGVYQIPDEPIMGGIRLTPIIPQAFKQRYPMVYVCNSDGCQGLLHRESDESDLEWFQFAAAPRLVPKQHELLRQPSSHPDEEVSADSTLGCLACFCLDEHSPGFHKRLEPSLPEVVISREDASRVYDFVDRHPAVFSDATRLLWRRLGRDYDLPVERRFSGFAKFDPIGRIYRNGNSVDWLDLTLYLDEREQRLILGFYTKPLERYADPIRSARQVAKQLGRVSDE